MYYSYKSKLGIIYIYIYIYILNINYLIIPSILKKNWYKYKIIIQCFNLKI